jgi:hypothetical protein
MQAATPRRQQAATPEAPTPAVPFEKEPASTSAPVRDVSLNLKAASGSTVHLQFTERHGEVQVISRTSDTVLRRELTDGLADLRTGIEQAGLSADVWPADQAGSSPDSNPGGKHPAEGGAGERHFARTFGDGAGSGYGSGRNGTKWIDLVEDSLDGAFQGGKQ